RATTSTSGRAARYRIASASSMPTSMSRTTRWRSFTSPLLLRMMVPWASCGDLDLCRALGKRAARPAPAGGTAVDHHEHGDGREVRQHVHELGRDALALEPDRERV